MLLLLCCPTSHGSLLNSLLFRGRRILLGTRIVLNRCAITMQEHPRLRMFHNSSVSASRALVASSNGSVEQRGFFTKARVLCSCCQAPSADIGTCFDQLHYIPGIKNIVDAYIFCMPALNQAPCHPRGVKFSLTVLANRKISCSTMAIESASTERDLGT